MRRFPLLPPTGPSAALRRFLGLALVALLSGSFDGKKGNDSVIYADTLVSEADVSITKSDGTETAVPGLGTSYTLVATNRGPSNDSAVRVVDVLPSALGCSWTSAAAGGASGSAGSGSGDIHETLNLPVGATVTYTQDCDISPGATGSLVTTATVSGSFDNKSSNDSATDTNTLRPRANIAVTKTNGATTSVPGESTSYTVLVFNSGPSNDPRVRVTDKLPASLTCSYTSFPADGAAGNTPSGSGHLDEGLSLPAGSSVTYTFDCDIDSAAHGSLTNTAEVAGSFDGHGGDDAATDTDKLAPRRSQDPMPRDTISPLS